MAHGFRGWLTGWLGLVWLAAGVAGAADSSTLQAEAYRVLDGVREGKHVQLTAYLERISKLAEVVQADPVMHRYFSIKRRYWRLQEEAPPPPEVKETIETLKASIRDHCLAHYQAFYDILFVDSSGYVLSSLRHQGEYHRNLFEGDLARTALSQHLRDRPGESFVDYEFYWVSDEPSAFFVEPLVSGDQQLGWFVLQCSLNRINAIFARGEGLGATGETFLVNRQHQMLTDSRLQPADPHRQRQLAPENIDGKFREGQGHKRIVDYRGFPALTSFKVCPVLGSEWLLVAKIDEDEVLTRHYRDNLAELEPALQRRVATARQPFCAPGVLPDQVVMVDMDEFRQSEAEQLITFGVCTCTAVVISLPGKVSYLGHASVHDLMYGAGDMDLVGNMLRSVQQFEILPYQLRDLEVVLVAPHRESLDGAVACLLDAGLLLSQIRFLYDPEADNATVVHDPATGQTLVRWTMGDRQQPRWQRAAEVPSLGDAVKEIVGYP